MALIRSGSSGFLRWGKEYVSFNKELCEGNARAEGVSNVRFLQGDATQLDFPDETFDAVASNYVYHNIPSKDRQAILLETLRTLKRTAAMSFSGSHLPLLLLEIWRLSILCRRARGKGYWKQQADPVTRFRPGAALTAAPEDAVRRSTIPLLIGNTAEEGNLFIHQIPDIALPFAARFIHLPVGKSRQRYRSRFSNALTNHIYVHPQVEMLRNYSGPVWRYEYQYVLPGSRMGCFHASELPVLFGLNDIDYIYFMAGFFRSFPESSSHLCRVSPGPGTPV